MTLIAELKTRRDNLAGYLAALDTVIRFEVEIKALLTETPGEGEVLPVIRADADGVVRRERLAPGTAARSAKRVTVGRKDQTAPAVARRGKPAPAREAIVRAIEALPEPFTMPDVREWVLKHEPAIAKSMGKSTWSTSMFQLRVKGWIGELGEKKNGTAAYKRGRHFGAVETIRTAKEQAYREFRQTIPTPSSVD